MIYTVTFNPSLDYVVSVENFRLGCTNRTESERLFAGGKGVNVSVVLNNLGIENTALGFTAGFVGDEIERRLEEMGIRTDFIRVSRGVSRINLKLRSIEGTEINGRGPEIDSDSAALLLAKLDRLGADDVLFLSGSVPPTVSDQIYSEIMGRLEDRGTLVAVDATEKLLTDALRHRPFLIKPNHRELGEIFGLTLRNRDDVIPYGRKLQQMGARNVLISLAGEGAVLVAEDGRICRKAAPKGEVINGTGAGDAMLAGFMAGWMRYRDYARAFYMGLAAGSASAFAEHLAGEKEIMALYEQLRAEDDV